MNTIQTYSSLEINHDKYRTFVLIPGKNFAVRHYSNNRCVLKNCYNGDVELYDVNCNKLECDIIKTSNETSEFITPTGIFFILVTFTLNEIDPEYSLQYLSASNENMIDNELNCTMYYELSYEEMISESDHNFELFKNEEILLFMGEYNTKTTLFREKMETIRWNEISNKISSLLRYFADNFSREDMETIRWNEINNKIPSLLRYFVDNLCGVKSLVFLPHMVYNLFPEIEYELEVYACGKLAFEYIMCIGQTDVHYLYNTYPHCFKNKNAVVLKMDKLCKHTCNV